MSNTTDHTNDSDFDDRVAESVSKILQAQQGLSPTARRCTSCWRYSRQLGSLGNCQQRCSMRGPDPDYVLCRRLNMGGTIESTVSYNGLAYTLAHAAGISATDFLSDEKISDEEIIRIYDAHTIKLDLPRRPPSPAERAQADQIQEDTRKRDRRRTLISQKKSVEEQIQRLSTRLSSLDAEIEDLPEAE